MVSATIVSKNLKERFIARTFQQNATLKSAFVSWKDTQSAYVSYNKFNQLIKMWGFIVTEAQIEELFKWLDADKDG